MWENIFKMSEWYLESERESWSVGTRSEWSNIKEKEERKKESIIIIYFILLFEMILVVFIILE